MTSALDNDVDSELGQGCRNAVKEERPSLREDTRPFGPGTVSRTTETQIEWENYHSMENLEIKEDELVLKETQQKSESYTGYTQVDVTDYTSIYVDLEGGGGAAAYEGDLTWYSPGGAGGALEGWFDVSSFDTLEIWVGEGGGYSDSGGSGGWGRYSGGDGGDYAGGGGGSTEIVADGTFLAAADAGGGGGAWYDYGTGETTYGGGGGARGGQGGSADKPGEDAGGSGTGGDGADDSEEDGGDGSGEYNNAYWLGGPGWTKGGGGSGGQNPEEHGADGSASIEFHGYEDQGERISHPLSLDEVDYAGESLIEWDKVSTGNTDITIYTAITNNDTTVPDNWQEATNGGSIPGINPGDDLTGKYLWTRQVFSTSEGSETPRLNRLTEEIVDYHTLTVDSTSGGEVIQPGEGEFGYEYDSVVEIEAVPNEQEGYHFIEWIGDTGSIEDTKSKVTNIQMIEDQQITARFATETYTLTVESTDGGEVVEPGEDDFVWEHGDVVDLEAVAEEGHHFLQWSGDTETIEDTTATSTTITMNSDYNITAEFEATPELTVDIAAGEGSIEVNGVNVELPYSEYYSQGESVDLKAVPAEDHRFDHWEGDIPQDEEEVEDISVVMDEDRVIDARFVEVFKLTVNIEGEGTVEVDGEEVEDGWEGQRERGVEVAMQASSDEGWTFGGWTGDYEGSEEQINITMDSDKNIEAGFERIEHELVIIIEGEGTTSPPEGSQTYPHGESVMIEAFPDQGWVFDQWTGDHGTTEEGFTITMDQDKELRAHFLREPVLEGEIVSPEEGESFALQDEIAVEFSVTNQGGISGEEVVEFYVDGEPTGKEQEVSIGPDETKTVEFTWEPPEEGEFQLEIRSGNESLDTDTEVVTVSVVDESPLLPWWSYVLFIIIALFLIVALFWKKRREEQEKVLPLKEPKISKIKKKRGQKLEKLEKKRSERPSEVSSLSEAKSERAPPSQSERRAPSSQSEKGENGAVGGAGGISTSPQPSKEKCNICLSAADPENRLQCECGAVYHDDCLRVEGKCPECGNDYASVSSVTEEDEVSSEEEDLDDEEEEESEEVKSEEREDEIEEDETEEDEEELEEEITKMLDEDETESNEGVWTDKKRRSGVEEQEDITTEKEESEKNEVEETIKCPVCKSELQPGSDECWACGADLDEEE
ncbi:MAG: Ig-like domain-containing protein [Candidatus Thermoplasmatota archaeon]